VINEIRAADAAGLAALRELFAEYAASLGPGHLCLQDFNSEVAGLPGYYVLPGGGLWMAIVEEQPAGCVALRPLDGDSAELKRLYVRPQCRGHRLGKLLVDAAVNRARTSGKTRVRLDTFPSMVEAVGLYRALGFRAIDPYHAKALPGSIFFELTLTDPGDPIPVTP
jgi:ribosomal protein S18 acetylase RimI-like enzyme